jgi:hypothetical protein
MVLWQKISFGMVTFALAVIAGVTVSNFSLSGAGECRNQIISESNAPGDAMKYVVFQRDCGATTGFSTQVSLIKVGETLKNEVGNAFIADTNHDEAPSGAGGGSEVRIKWVSDTHIEIHHHQFTRVFRAERAVDGVQVDYETFK